MSEAKDKGSSNPGVEPVRRAAWVAIKAGKMREIQKIKRPLPPFATLRRGKVEENKNHNENSLKRKYLKATGFPSFNFKLRSTQELM